MPAQPAPLMLTADQSPVGVLLLHGFTGTTLELEPLGRHLHAEGWTVHAPLLKGHGLTPEEMGCTTWVDWFVSAKEGYRRLLEEGCAHIVVVGLSMGGLLAIKVAQHEPVVGIVTLCAPMRVRDPRLSLAKYAQYVLPYAKRRGRKADHIEPHLYVYERTPLSCVVSLEELMHNVRHVLPCIKQPALIIQAEQDETVHPCSGQMLYEQLGSTDKELVMFKQSGHIITLDHEQERLHEKVTQFIRCIENKMQSFYNT
ncbi:carboxylesterase [Caldalkalibacillus uzonensis]|uniref:Carboxylesterase n=1 Tax=Caldalkalibacillus uzonensis TaxID=353224 RepID=A0ABU0CPS9_9BACI|nr:alpha/beta fold hydrolase [Caldalkalibacillus uzonensis]MDQ0338422.1 carboxylesterase [Caldalkalibacillus uzonensis]